MDRLIAANSVPMAQADTAPLTGTPQGATDGNPASNTPATRWPSYQYNAIQEELVAILAAAGVVPDRTNNAQIVSAIRALVQKTAELADTGVANAYAAANAVPLTSSTWIDGVVQAVNIAHANTGASTYAPDGLTAIPIYGLGLKALQGGEIVAGGTAILMHATIAGVNSGNPICVLMECAGGAQQIPPATQSQHAMQVAQAVGRYLGTQLISSSMTVNPGTYTKNGLTITATTWRVRGVGGGGGSAGAAVTGASTVSVGTGGQSGAYCEFVTAAVATAATIGAAGAAGTTGNGGTGGTSTFGSLASLPGGIGGGIAGPAAPPFTQVTGGATGGPTGSATFYVSLPGQLGAPAICVSTAAILSGGGGSNPIGTGGNASVGGAAQGPSGFGSGAGGAANPVSTAARNGNTGSPGYWIVDEFA